MCCLLLIGSHSTSISTMISPILLQVASIITRWHSRLQSLNCSSMWDHSRRNRTCLLHFSLSWPPSPAKARLQSMSIWLHRHYFTRLTHFLLWLTSPRGPGINSMKVCCCPWWIFHGEFVVRWVTSILTHGHSDKSPCSGNLYTSTTLWTQPSFCTCHVLGKGLQ